MLIELFGRNFDSFRDDFRLSMLATDIDPDNERGLIEVPLEGEAESLRLLRCAAIYGPNASGKSNLLRAASALAYLLQHSADMASDATLEPYEPFLLDDESRHSPVALGLRAVIDGCVYEYDIEFEQMRFVRENLVEIRGDERILLFARQDQNVEGPWTSDSQFALLVQSFRPNALLLSLADRLAPDLDGGIAVGFRRLLGFHDPTWTSPLHRTQQSARRAAADEAGFGNWLLDWLRCADIGVVNYVAEKIPDDPRPDDSERVNARPKIDFMLNLVHGSAHDPVKFPYSRESLGTRKMVELAPFIYDLTKGDEVRAYFVDEIGASMHPHLVEGIVRHFNCDVPPESVRGQLIFATQETTLLDAEARDATLRRDQVYFTEKNSSGVSRLYSLAEFKERNNLNPRRRYLQGRYGALPALGRMGD